MKNNKPAKTSGQVLAALQRHGLLSPRDLKRLPTAKVYLSRLAKSGRIQQFGRGVYAAAGHVPTRFHSYAVACKRSPEAVVCLLSALAFHELTTQSPGRVWLAIGPKTWPPHMTVPRIRIVRYSEESFREGIEIHSLEGVKVRVYGVAKTVADLFKFRNKVGLDVAMEALRECLKQKRCSPDDLLRYARICRVERIMRPYLEMAVAA
jgi:predicted transcriptional regulator of viral defense system